MTPPADIQFESRPALAAPSQPFRILVVEVSAPKSFKVVH